MGDPVIKYGATYGGLNPVTGQPYKYGDDIYYNSPLAPTPPAPDNMNQELIHVSLAFAKLKNAPLAEFASNVFTRMTANAAIFSALPFPLANLNTAQGVYRVSVDAAADGGTQLMTDKAAKGRILIGLLRQLAAYVQAIPNIMLANAQLSGFVVTASGKRPAVTLTVPVILKFTNINSGQLGVKLKGSRGAKGYEFRYILANGTVVNYGTFTSTRGIVLTGLIPGTVYEFQVRAFAGNNQFSPWSESVKHMCT